MSRFPAFSSLVDLIRPDVSGARLRRAPLVRLASVVALGAVVAACQPEAAVEEDVAKPARTVWVEPATPAGGRTISLTGIIRARSDAPIAFRVGGKISDRVADIGDRVKPGDVVAVLDASDLGAALRAREAEERAARAQSRRAAEDRLRVAALKEKGHVSQAALDQAVASDDAAAASLKAAVEQRILAANQLAYARLEADVEGVVTAVLAEPGEVVTAGQPVLRIARDAEREVEVAIPEAQVAAVSGAAPRITLWAEPDRSFRATLREMSPVADAAARSFTARFSILDPGVDARLGMTATVHLDREADAGDVAVPLAAVWYDGSQANVWHAEPGAEKVEPVAVTVRRIEAERAIVSGGIATGEHVVSMGAHRLDTGLRLRVVARDTAGPVRVGALR